MGGRVRPPVAAPAAVPGSCSHAEIQLRPQRRVGGGAVVVHAQVHAVPAREDNAVRIPLVGQVVDEPGLDIEVDEQVVTFREGYGCGVEIFNKVIR